MLDHLDAQPAPTRHGSPIVTPAESLRTTMAACHVEPEEQGRWLADLSPVNGPVLGPFDHRSEALQAEHDWLERHWLLGSV